MKSIFILTTVILSLLPSLWSCQKEDIGNPQENPQEAIIGKWEKIAEEQEGNRIIPVETDGNYMEFLANGVFQFSSDGFGEGKWTYQIDNVYLYRYNSFDDTKPKVIDEYTFINRNMLKLKEARTAEFKMPYPYFYIYQRINE